LTRVVSSGNTWGVPVLLHHWREKRGLSVRGLATLARVGFVTVSRVEHGRLNPSVDLLEKLARALKITMRDFFPVGWPSVRRSRQARPAARQTGRASGQRSARRMKGGHGR
jgi:transcriptional regulator with XRE-family HTH domain